MKQVIEQLIERFKRGLDDTEIDHMTYDKVIEAYCLNYDPELLPLIKELIELRQMVTFWYA